MSEQAENANVLVDFFYYKNTPLQKELFAKIRTLFWKLLKQVLDSFAG